MINEVAYDLSFSQNKTSLTPSRQRLSFPSSLNTPLFSCYPRFEGSRTFKDRRTMSAVNITNVTVLDNPASFLSPFQFEISYECLAALKDDLEWKLIYVGSAEDETYDQLLESVLVGPVNVGNYRFVLQADPPDPTKIREEDIIGVTVLLLTCSYLGQEFIRVGYYVNNDYDDEQLREEPPTKVLTDRVQRNILSDKPRVTKFPINFHPENTEIEEQPVPSEQQPETVEDPSAVADCDPLNEGDKKEDS